MRRYFYTLLVLFCSALIPVSAQVQINEINALNRSGMVNPVTGEPGDWIELYSPLTTVDLEGWYLSDDPGDPFKWRFPKLSQVPGQGYLLLWADGSGDTTEYLRPNFKLSVAGECLLLSDSTGMRIDSLCFPRMYEDDSYGINADGEKLFFENPSPGAWNYSTTAYRKSGLPRFSLAAGVYATSQSVELLSDEEGPIRYTTDGTMPGHSSTLYQEPITVSTNTVLRARLFQVNHEPGDVVTATYLLHPEFTLPVVSLVTDPDNLFDNETGMYVTGTNGVAGYCSKGVPHNFNQDWERPVSFEYIDREGVQQLQLDAGMKIHGGCSRGAPMKSLAIFARGQYGSSSIEYPFFREKPEKDEFEGIMLRNGGNDFWYSFIRDGVIQASVSQVMDLDYQAFEQVQVFINGEYWGIHNLREKVNEHWVNTNYNIPPEDIDFMKNDWGLFAGTRDKWDELQAFLEQNSLADEANYQWVDSQVDLNSYQDFLITQLFYANRDWPGNNQKMWRKRVENGKWRYIMFDMEFAMGLYDNNPTRNMFEFATADTTDNWPNPRWATLIIRRLMENPGFRDQFIQKYMLHLNTTLSTERVIGVIDSFQNNMIDLYPEHTARWGLRDMDGWLEQVEQLRDFARQRPDWVWKHMREFFDLDETVNVSVSNEDPGGILLLNGMALDREGMNGPYLKGTKLDLDYHIKPGYRFSHWEITLPSDNESLLLVKQSEWRYSDSETLPGEDWKESEFDDSSWSSGNGPLGYGEAHIVTGLSYGPDDQNKYPTAWFRRELQVDDPALYSDLIFRVMRDDGIVVYVNGREAFRDNMPEGEITQDTRPITWVGNEDETRYFEYIVDPSVLSQGSNVIAVEVHQVSGSSSDLSFDMEISALGLGDELLSLEENPLSLDVQENVSVKAVSEAIQLDLDLIINEIMASNKGVVVDEQGGDGDWIEIYNAGNNAVDMAGLWFTDDLTSPEQWQIPGGSPEETTVESGGFLVFFADGNPLSGIRHLDFKLSSAGEAVGLSYRSADEIIWIDSLSFEQQYSNISSGRWPDGDTTWVLLEHTAGGSNIQRTVSIQETLLLDFSLYPNPATDFAFLKVFASSGRLEGDVEILISDLQGRIVMQKKEYTGGGSVEFRLDLQSLDAGMYLVSIRSGRYCESTRMIITGR